MLVNAYLYGDALKMRTTLKYTDGTSTMKQKTLFDGTDGNHSNIDLNDNFLVNVLNSINSAIKDISKITVEVFMDENTVETYCELAYLVEV